MKNQELAYFGRNIDTRKQKIIGAFYRFVAKRPGLEFGNYGSVPAYRLELRRITKMRHKAERLLEQVAWRESVTADNIVAACRGAFSGRLSIREENGVAEVDYCTGQFWPTEYRAAVCAVLRNVLTDEHTGRLGPATYSRGKIKGDI